MNPVAVPVIIVFVIATIALFAATMRRLLGLRFSWWRTVAAAAISFLLASPIITAISGPTATTEHELLPELWFVLLGIACSLLVGMVFLVVAEALLPSGSLPGPIFLIRATRQRTRRIARYRQIVRILLRHRLTPYLRGGRRAELASPEGRAHLARSLRLALDDGGLTFIKIGQLLSTRRDLLPSEFTDELTHLQDHAAPVGWPQIEQILNVQWKTPLSELFAEFDRTPIAAASVAQVHAAVLRSGERVVVKICRPGIRASLEGDLDILARLALILQRRTRWGTDFGAVELTNGFADALRRELDLGNEARNLVTVASALTTDGRIRIPTPYAPLCTSEVLVMQRFDGVPITRARHAEVARQLLDCLLRQVLVDGVFHADLHPGNILLLDDGDIGLLDFGSVGHLDSALRTALQQLLLAVDQADPLALSDALIELAGRRLPDLDEVRLQRALGRFMSRYLRPGVTADARIFTDLVRIIAEHGLTLPPEIAAAFRALATLEGTLTQIAPGFDTVAHARTFAYDYAAEQLRPDALRRTAHDDLAAILPTLRRLPRRLDRITSALETGQLSVNVRLLADVSDREMITGMLHQFLLTILAAATGVMAVLLLGLHGGPTITTEISLDQFFGYCLLLVAATLALRVLVVVFRPQRHHPRRP